MSLSTKDVQAVQALWEEWTPGSGLSLSIEVWTEDPATAILIGDDGEIKGAPMPARVTLSGAPTLGARVTGDLYCRLRVWRDGGDDQPVIDQRVEHDAECLRACVMVLAQAIAAEAGR